MSHSALLWRAAAELAQSETLGAIATVSRRRGSLPMAQDAKMVVAEDGRRWGTVGGGCTEADVTMQALEAARDGVPKFVQHTLNADLAGDVGLSCGGTVGLFLEPIVASPEMARLYAAVAQGIEERIPVTVLTAVDWAGGSAKRAVIGGDVITVGPIPAPRAPSSERRAPDPTAHVDEDSGLFIEHLLRVPRLIVFGAGHVGVEIARLAAGVGFYVLVVDDRAEYANGQRLPEAHEVFVEDFRTFLDRLNLDEDDYVLATTRGHSYDAYIIERTAASRARYVGMLGSRRKKDVVFRSLEAAGVSRTALDRVVVPIGEPIGADTPEEIAVSVVAELIKVRRVGIPSPPALSGSPPREAPAGPG
jgi:xanthine dehydrogenase accessory factor